MTGEKGRKSEKIPPAAFSYRNSLLELLADGKMDLETAAQSIRDAAADDESGQKGWDEIKEKLLQMGILLYSQKQTPPPSE